MTDQKPHKKFHISGRTILSIVTVILVGIVVWQNRESISGAIEHIGEANIWVVLLLIPEQLFMYYCCGQIFFSFMAGKKNAKKVSPFTLMRVSLELNFVNHAVPAGGFGGLAYISWRLKEFGATPGQSSFMYALRYAITVIANQIQTIIAIIILFATNTVPIDTPIVWIAAAISFGFIIGITALILVASKAKRIHWVSNLAAKVCNWCVKTFTFGKKRNKLTYDVIDKYLMDIHGDLMMAKVNKRMLLRPVVWGFVYSFFEISTYWIVAISLGYPLVMPQIMIGEAIGSVAGMIFPIGPYEVSMVGVIATLLPGAAADAVAATALATAIVCITRVVVLATTILSGYGFYQGAISKIGKTQGESGPFAKNERNA